MPYTVAFGIVRLAFATIFKRNEKLPHVLIPCRFESRLKPLRYTNGRAQELLGWRPPFDYSECLRRTYGPYGSA
jgi:nucleoside-diphosphate-sugar epimerase